MVDSIRYDIDDQILFDSDDICSLSKSHTGFCLCDCCGYCEEHDVDDEYF